MLVALDVTATGCQRFLLAAVLREQEVAACLEAAAAPQRLTLGRLLEADVLVLLSLVERAVPPADDGGSRKRFLRGVLSDCVYGARLHVDYLPLDAGALDALADRCAATVLETQRRFVGGIDRLIAVTHFLSRNLRHDYDHL